MVPSGYKEDTVYSVVPSDGSGDLSFTRASNGTRINSAGLVEVVAWNLLEQSVWPSIGTGIAPTSWAVGTGPATNFSAGPLAGQLLCNTSANRGFIQQTLSFTAGEYALSVFVDSVTTAGPIAQLISIFGSTGVKYYEDGIEVTSSTSIVAGKRYTVVGTVTTGSFTLRIGSGITGNTTANYVISRPQLNIGSTAKPYFPTTDRLNVPRLTYQNGGGGCPSLLLEPQRTNLLTWSDDFSNAAWSKDRIVVTANATTSPDGTQNADKIADTLNGNNTYRIFNSTTLSAISYTQTFYAKAAEYNWCYVRIGNASRAWFNVGTGVVGTVDSGLTASIQSVGDGWYRIITTITTATAGSGFGLIALTTGNGVESYTPTTGGMGIYVYGAQLEAGAYPTSYIPTTSSSATRILDVCAKTGVSSLIGQTEGTLFVEFKIVPINSNSVYAGISDGTSANFILVGKEAGVFPNKVVFFIVANSTFILNDTSIAMTSNFVKCAIAYKSGNWAAYFNGTLVASGTSTFSFSSTFGTFGFGSNPALTTTQDSIEIKESVLFKTRLTNAELQALTA